MRSASGTNLPILGAAFVRIPSGKETRQMAHPPQNYLSLATCADLDMVPRDFPSGTLSHQSTDPHHTTADLLTRTPQRNSNRLTTRNRRFLRRYDPHQASPNPHTIAPQPLYQPTTLPDTQNDPDVVPSPDMPPPRTPAPPTQGQPTRPAPQPLMQPPPPTTPQNPPVPTSPAPSRPAPQLPTNTPPAPTGPAPQPPTKT